VSLDERKLAAARLWATARLPYLATVVFACAVRPRPDSGTISVDRSWQLHADPAVIDALEIDELGKLILHLCGHLIRDHGARAQRLGVAEQHRREHWNRAADAELNDDLAASGCVPSVAGELPTDLGCEDGKLAEHYYERGAAGPRRWDCGSGADGCDRPGERDRGAGTPGAGIGGHESELLRLGVAAEVHRYAAQHPGTVPAGWLRWAESVLPSRVDWRRVLAAELRSAVAAVSGMVDYSYRRPSRRAHASPDVVLPTLERPVPEVAIVCDTSGSMHDGLLARALAEVEGVLRRGGLRGRQVRVLAVDTAVHAVKRVSRASQVELAGGGGTDMGSGIEAAAALRPRPSIVIVLTDGFTPWPETAPRGVRVVVGLLTQGAFAPAWPPPSWARVVVIAD
jgi:predicted metal-dependent peptidase